MEHFELILIYLANILVAGWVGLTSLFAPAVAVRSVWQGTTSADGASLRVVGALWTSIALLSLFGLFNPLGFAPVLLLQLIYKGGWLLAVALPARLKDSQHPLPMGMSLFFAVWVFILPMIMPWSSLF